MKRIKRIAYIAFALLLAAGTAFAQTAPAQDQNIDFSTKNWINHAGAAFGVPISKYKIDGNNIDQIAVTLDAMYLGIYKNGFSAKANVGAGVALTKSISFAGASGTQCGAFLSAQLGAGYTFLRTKKFTVSAFGMLGIEGALYQTEKKPYKHKELGVVDRSLSAGIAVFSLGADITAVFYPIPRLGIFCNVAGRYLPFALMNNGAKYAYDDYTRYESYKSSGNGVFSVTPSVGALWRW